MVHEPAIAGRWLEIQTQKGFEPSN